MDKNVPKEIKIRKVKVLDSERAFEVTMSNGKVYRIENISKERYTVLFRVAQWMEEHKQNTKELAIRKIHAKILVRQLRTKKEDDPSSDVDFYEDKIYIPWLDYTNLKRIKETRIFILRERVERQDWRTINNRNSRVSFAEAFFKHEGKDINWAKFWFGDDEKTKVEIFLSKELYERDHDILEMNPKTLKRIFDIKHVTVVARELHHIFCSIPEIGWNKINVCDCLLYSIQWRIALLMPDDDIIELLNECLKRNRENKLSKADVSNIWYLIRGISEQMLKKVDFNFKKGYNFAKRPKKINLMKKRRIIGLL